ncbi:MAG TPA: hypothetical protein VNQ79_08525 [Blastocatellia bacterium]|nr:hypothetical protein [Blastocatellia bacterium]
MSDDSLDRKIEFLAEQEARLFARLEKLSEEVGRLLAAQAQSEERLHKSEELTDKHDERISNLEGAMTAAFSMINSLAEQSKETDRRVKETTASVNIVSARVDDLTGRMDNFISLLVERYFNEQNGNGKKKNDENDD